MGNSTKRLLSILLTLILVTGSVFLYSTLIKSAYSSIQQQRSELANRVNILKENRLLKEKADKLASDFEDSADIVNVLLKTLPDEANYSNIINQINGISKINNLNINSFSLSKSSLKPSSSSLVKPIGSVSIQIPLSGNYESFKSFLKDIESNIGLMDIKEVSISQVPLKTSIDFDYSLSINSYYEGNN